MDDPFFLRYSPSDLYASIGCGAEYVSYEDQNITHLDMPFLFPSENIFRLGSFIDMCQKHHADDSGLTGDYEEVWVGGVLKARGGFCSGRPFGCWRFFHDNGRCAEVVRLDAEGNIQSEHVLFHQNGNRMFSFHHQGLKLTGILKEGFSNGQVKSEIRAHQGKRDGLCRSWHENGRLASEGAFTIGAIFGDYKQWNSDGVLVYEREGVENTKICYEKQYNDQGQIQRVRPYLNNELHGEQIVYFDYERRIMLEKPRMTYYLHGREVAEAEFVARLGRSFLKEVKKENTGRAS